MDIRANKFHHGVQRSLSSGLGYQEQTKARSKEELENGIAIGSMNYPPNCSNDGGTKIEP